MVVMVVMVGLWTHAAVASPAGDRGRARAVRMVAEAEAVGRALARVQNDWGARVLLVRPAPGCTDRVAGDRAARARVFGADWHRRLDELDSELEKLARRHGEQGLDDLRAALLSQQEAYRAAARWQARLVEPWSRRCRLQVLPGPGPAEPGGSLAEAGLVAVIGVSGLVCPAMVPGTGAVVVVDGPACADTLDGCSCVPHEVLPGGAMAPQR